MKQVLIRCGVLCIFVLCIYMIAIGSLQHSSSPIQEEFLYTVGDTIPTNASLYVRGCTVPDKVDLDFSQVDTTTAGVYEVKVSQPGATYTFKIRIQ